MQPTEPRHLAVFFPGFKKTGVVASMMTLARALAEMGHRVDVLVARGDGPTRPEGPVHANLRIVDLRDWRRTPGWGSTRRHVFTSVPAMARYLRSERPAALLSGANHANFTAVAGRIYGGVNTRVVVSQRAHFSIESRDRRVEQWIVRHAYPLADAVVAVSQGVADDLVRAAGIPADRVVTIYNPVDLARVRGLAKEPVSHPWLADEGPPVVLGVGRLHEQKDFPTLLRAFARLRKARDAQLVILGSGGDLAALERQAEDLGIASDVSFVGYVANPFPYMARASVFALSSAWEGFTRVLLEAMACGCPVVSTDCPSGPAELLTGELKDRLVPVGDDAAMALALARTLDRPPAPELLARRIEPFSADAIAARYCEVLLG